MFVVVEGPFETTLPGRTTIGVVVFPVVRPNFVNTPITVPSFWRMAKLTFVPLGKIAAYFG